LERSNLNWLTEQDSSLRQAELLFLLQELVKNWPGSR
jgi:hypothetical protein